MNRRWFLLAASGALAVLAGCVATVKQNVNFQPTVATTLPEQVAIKYLRSLPVDINGACVFSTRGLSGMDGLKGTGYTTYSDWHISGVGEFSQIAASGVAIMLRVDDAKTIWGKYCIAYYRKGAHLSPAYEEELNKAVTALVSLGVKYDPATSREW